MNRIKMNEIIKTFGVFLVVAIVACGLVFPQSASAAPPAPNWIPGQPLLAGTQVIAMWLPVPGAVKYIVFLNGEKIAESPANQYMGAAPSEGGEYRYEVLAVDASGAESPKSPPGIIKIITLEAPTDLLIRANLRDKSIAVRWGIPAGGVISNIYRGDAAAGPFALVASVQADSYKDSDVEVGKEYFYVISAKDITGREGPKSAPTLAKIEEQSAAETKAKVKIKMVIVPSKEVDRVYFLGDFDFQDVGHIYHTPSDDLWLAMGPKGTVHHFDSSRNLVASYNVAQIAREAGYKWKMVTSILIDEDLDRFYVSDGFYGSLAMFEGGQLAWITKPQLPPADRDDLWMDGRLSSSLKGKNPTLAVPYHVSCCEELWVVGGTVPVIHVLDPDSGEYIDWWSGYNLKEEDKKKEDDFRSFGGVGNVFEFGDGKVLIGEPLLHVGVVIDAASKEIQYLIGEEHDGFIGGFLGLGEAVMTPDGKGILIPDPGTGNYQVFDPATGKYMFHIGGVEAKPDPEFGNQRAIMDGVGTSDVVWFDKSGKLWIYDGSDKSISVREVSWDDKREVVIKEGSK